MGVSVVVRRAHGYEHRGSVPAGPRYGAGRQGGSAPAPNAAPVHPSAIQPATGHPGTAHQAAGHQGAGHLAGSHFAGGHPAGEHPAQGYPAGYPAANYPAQGYPVTGHPTAPRPATTQPARGYPATGPAHGYAAAPSQAVPSYANGVPQSTTVAAQIGSFFRDLRRNFKISQPEIASRLSTRIEIIAALEAGDVRNLPHWPETCRIVQTYTGLVGLDPRPVLRLIEMMQIRTGRSPTPAQAYEDESGILSRTASGLKRGWSGGIGQAACGYWSLSAFLWLLLCW